MEARRRRRRDRRRGAAAGCRPSRRGVPRSDPCAQRVDTGSSAGEIAATLLDVAEQIVELADVLLRQPPAGLRAASSSRPARAARAPGRSRLHSSRDRSPPHARGEVAPASFPRAGRRRPACGGPRTSPALLDAVQQPPFKDCRIGRNLAGSRRPRLRDCACRRLLLRFRRQCHREQHEAYEYRNWKHQWNDSSLPCTRRAGTGRPRPASAVRKIVAAHTLATLVPRRVRDALGRHMPGALMRRRVVWALCGSHGPNSSRGIAAPIFQLRSAWPAPDGRGRPAPARRGRAAPSEFRGPRPRDADPRTEPERRRRVAGDGAPLPPQRAIRALGTPVGAQASPVTSALCRAPSGAVAGQTRRRSGGDREGRPHFWRWHSVHFPGDLIRRSESFGLSESS